MTRPNDETGSIQGSGFQGEQESQHADIATIGTPNHEDRIKSLGQDLINAYANGDRDIARKFQKAMYGAIAQRTPAAQAERFREIDAAIFECAP